MMITLKNILLFFGLYVVTALACVLMLGFLGIMSHKYPGLRIFLIKFKIFTALEYIAFGATIPLMIAPLTLLLYFSIISFTLILSKLRIIFKNGFMY
jgi:hypothetical protein